MINSAGELESLASSVTDCGDVYFVPSFNGIFSPYWRDDARGLLIGLSMNTSKGHLARALLEAPCLRTKEVLDSMSQDASSIQLSRINVDGGMSVNNFML